MRRHVVTAAKTTWDQRATLRPAPFSGPLSRLVRGVHVGDALFDALPAGDVCCHGGKCRTKVSLGDAPAWVDWAKVRRGQAVFNEHLGQFFVALSVALLQGFSIARFAEVLHANGYAQSPVTAYERYQATGFAIVDWMAHPLDEPGSLAVEQARNVRAMHSFARRRAIASGLFPHPEEEGIPLSQFDVAITLLGFAGVAPSIVESELGAAPLAREDREALCHVWRLLGFYAGILDEFNPCNSLDEMEAMVLEFLSFTPTFFATCRPCTFDLQASALQGFGMYTGVGVEFFVGVLHSTCAARGFEIDYLKRKSIWGMRLVGADSLRLLGYRPVNALVSAALRFQRARWLDDAASQRKLLPVLRAASLPMDLVVWRVAGAQAAVVNSWWGRLLIFVLLARRAARVAARRGWV